MKRVALKPLVCLVIVAGLLMAHETRDLLASGLRVGDVAARVGGDVGQRLGVAVKLAQKLTTRACTAATRIARVIGSVDLLPVVWIWKTIATLLGYAAIALPPPVL